MPNHLSKGGAAVQSRITHFKPGIGTLAPDGITPLWQSFSCHGQAKRGYLPARSPASRSLAEGRRFGEGRGEIFRRICLINYGLLSNGTLGTQEKDRGMKIRMKNTKRVHLLNFSS